MQAHRHSARAVLVAGLLLGLVDLVALPLTRPEQLGLAARVYTHAAEAVLAGGDLYAARPPGLEAFGFVYPPVVALAFLPYGLLGNGWVAFGVQTVLNVATGLGLAWLLVEVLEGYGVAMPRRDRGLVAGFCLCSVHSAPTMVNGQLNLQLALLIAGGLVALERGRETLAGTALAAAATVKLFPATLGALLLRRRAWRATAVALGTGLGLLAVGTLALGVDPLATFLTETLPGEAKAGALAANPLDQPYQTVRRQLAAVLPGVPPGWLPILGVLVVSPVVAVLYRRGEDPVARLLAVHGTILGTLLVLPLEPLYYPLAYYPFLVLLYVLPAGPARWLYLAGAGLTLLSVTPPAFLAQLTALGLPAGLEAPLVAAAEAVLTVVLPGTLGMWLILAAGLTYQWRGPARA